MAMVFKYKAEDLPLLEAELERIKTEIAVQQGLLKEAEKNLDNDTANQILSQIKQLDSAMMKTKEYIQQATFAADSRSTLDKLDQILEKNNCLRVRFLDWLAAKLESWAVVLRNHAMRISTPCAIKLPNKQKEPNPSWMAKLGIKK
jgi:hypothetical protein